MDSLREYVATSFSVVVVNVFYHCFYSRLDNGATLAFDDLDIHYLKEVIQKFNIDFSDVSEITKEGVLRKLHSVDKDITISMTLVPKNDEYQNFGLMQAADHLNVLNDLHENFDETQELPVVCFGSSHGGYIAHMMAKMAPSSISYIVDNSSYAKASLQHIVGKETNVNSPEYFLHEGKLRVHCFVQTYWSTDANSPYYFSDDRVMIRDISNLKHIEIMSKVSEHKTGYSLYHSLGDTIAPIEDKQLLYTNLVKNGYQVKFHTFSREDEIDGKFIKNLDHGMSMSVKELVKKELPEILQNYKALLGAEEQVEYECSKLTYTFNASKSIYKTN